MSSDNSPEDYSPGKECLQQERKKTVGKRLLRLIRPGSVTCDAWNELEKGRGDDRLDTSTDAGSH